MGARVVTVGEVLDGHVALDLECLCDGLGDVGGAAQWTSRRATVA